MTKKPHYSLERAKRHDYDGQSLTLREFSVTYGMPLKTIQSRMTKGWGIVRTMETPMFERDGHRWRTAHWRQRALSMERSRCVQRGLPPPRTVEDMPLSRDPWSQAAIDVAVELGGLTLDAVGYIQGGVTRERVRQIEESAFRKIRAVVGTADKATIIELLRGIDQSRRSQDPLELEEPMGADWRGTRSKKKEAKP